MEHNKEKYFRFLKIVYYTKLHIISCCCYGYMVTEQMAQLDSDISGMEEEMVDKKDRKKTHERQSTDLDTRNITIDDYKINTNGMELSVPAMVVIDEGTENK